MSEGETQNSCSGAAQRSCDAADAPMGLETAPDPYTPAPIRRMEGWSDGRYIIELEWVIRQQRKQLARLAEIRAILAEVE